MDLIQEIIIGAVLAAAIILLTRKIFPGRELKLYAQYFAIAALIYVAFLFGGSTLIWQLIEVSGLVLFGSIAYFSILKSLPVLLAIGWGIHPIWDWFLHNPIDTPFVPEAYPGVCIGFDLVMAIYIFNFSQLKLTQ